MVWANTFTKMVQFMRDNGVWTSITALAGRVGQMALFIRVVTNRGINRVREPSFGQTAVHILATSPKTIWKVLVFIDGRMVVSLMALGKTTKCMGEAFFPGKMDAHLKANINLTRNMDRVHLNGKSIQTHSNLFLHLT